MLDDRRADLLSRLLDERDRIPDDLYDRELASLAELGAELEQHRDRVAFMMRTDAEFDPAFARKLREALLAEHPGTGRAPQPAPTPEPSSEGARASRHWVFASRSRAYRALLLPFIAAALVITTVNALMHPSSSPKVATGVAATSTHTNVLSARMPGAQPASTAPTAFKNPVPAVRVFAAKQSTPSSKTGDRVPLDGQGFTPASTAMAHASADGHATGAGSSAARPLPTTAAATPTLSTSVGPPGGTAVARPFPTVAQSGSALTAPLAAVRLPPILPRLPSSADVYALHYARVAHDDVSRIAKSFPRLRKVGAGVYQSPGGQEDLTFDGDVPSHVSYKNSGNAAALGAVETARDASEIARGWLTLHHMAPLGVDLVRAHTVYSPATRTVVFGPPPAHGLSGSTAPSGISVVLGARRTVIAADILWPVLSPGKPQPLISLRQALAANGETDQVPTATQPATTLGAILQVDAIDLVYDKVGAGDALTWQPFYRLVGHVETPEGGRTHVVREIPATAIDK